MMHVGLDGRARAWIALGVTLVGLVIVLVDIAGVWRGPVAGRLVDAAQVWAAGWLTVWLAMWWWRRRRRPRDQR